ncbi:MULTISPECIES: aldo/keto reductase [Sphingobium]|jgi:2,5-diketo-D-gluconate reductase A|uniref:Aldo/keto reductase n=1 Tax=Sphingomonas sanxanigenens TaxID=397260 RepID=A0A2W5A8D9_9SPHN|nr:MULTISPECIES: aldo/keto reductase [Sphingobium]PZO90910.1 MAG: aldo/keto reductase [Sphingomonas sanxanigenens]
MTTRRSFLAAATAASLTPAILSAQARHGQSQGANGTVPLVTLNNGVKMPILGFGTFHVKPVEAAQMVQTAMGAGFRLIDTAKNYGNEAEVGDGIARSGVARNELFITTKLWIEDFGYDQAMRAFDLSISKLKLDYLDLYLLHWPVPMDFGKTIAAYKALEKLNADGCIRAIGVSNFNENHLDNLKAATSVVPAVNQIEINPSLSQQPMRAANARRGIATESWSPLGGEKNVGRHIANSTIREIATKHGKSPVQVIIRWHIERGLIVIPRSTNPSHIAENFDVLDFTLSESELASIDRINVNERSGPNPDTFDVEAYRKLIAGRAQQAR